MYHLRTGKTNRIDVPEWVVPMVVVEMSIASKHLLDDTLDIVVKISVKT